MSSAEPAGLPRPNLVLASRSPQRRAILEQLGISFTVRAPDVEELRVGEPEGLVVENARRKARAVSGDPVLGADTAVAFEGRIFGKPHDREEAARSLCALSGRTHEVWSGLALIEGGVERTAAIVTQVRFRDLSEADVTWYLATGEWRERAGAYAIQKRGAVLVAGIDGDYFNVVGLPVTGLLRLAPELVRGG